MKFSKFALFIFLNISLFPACKKHEKNTETTDDYSRRQLFVWNKKLNDVIIKDIFTPPVSSRIYAYTNIAAYEALVPGNPDYVSLAGQLNGLKELPKPEINKKYYFPLASIIAFSTVSQKLVLSHAKIDAYEKEYLDEIRQSGLDHELLQNSLAYGREVGKHIIEWMKKDGYAQVKSMPRYILTNKLGDWQPTPPDYAQAVEPHWGKIRSFALDSSAKFKTALPTPFDTIPKCQFYKESMEVYNVSKSIKGETLDIARFWDDNPNTADIVGHVTYYKQKLSPGGHWLSITSHVVKDKNLTLMESAEAYTLVSIALADAFINCWAEKYRMKTIRPETYITQYIDPDWVPTIQTPPFPEYPSGHSVISGSASAILTNMFGDTFAFTDSSEVPFGFKARTFKSFYAASEEAAISRLYGGIHFMPAISNGVKHGREIGNYIAKNVKTRKISQAYLH
jgi:hypothetical protein